MPVLPQQWNNSAAQASLAPPVTTPERYEELWWYSGAQSWGASATSAGIDFLTKGSYEYAGASNSSAVKLITLNSSANPSTQFAFEASLSSYGSQTLYVALWDVTSNSIVSASQLSTIATGYSIYRSGKFTLTPGHVFGVTTWWSGSVNDYNSQYVTDASLIQFSS